MNDITWYERRIGLSRGTLQPTTPEEMRAAGIEPGGYMFYMVNYDAVYCIYWATEREVDALYITHSGVRGTTYMKCLDTNLYTVLAQHFVDVTRFTEYEEGGLNHDDPINFKEFTQQWRANNSGK